MGSSAVSAAGAVSSPSPATVVVSSCIWVSRSSWSNMSRFLLCVPARRSTPGLERLKIPQLRGRVKLVLAFPAMRHFLLVLVLLGISGMAAAQEPPLPEPQPPAPQPPEPPSGPPVYRIE